MLALLLAELPVEGERVDALQLLGPVRLGSEKANARTHATRCHRVASRLQVE